VSLLLRATGTRAVTRPDCFREAKHFLHLGIGQPENFFDHRTLHDRSSTLGDGITEAARIKLLWRDPERCGECVNGLTDEALRRFALDVLDRGESEIRALGELSLRPSARHAETADEASERRLLRWRTGGVLHSRGR